MNKEDPHSRSTGIPPVSIIDCPVSTSTCPTNTGETILLRTDILSLQRNNRNLENQVEDLKMQLDQTSAELHDVKKRYSRDVSHLETELGLKEEVLEEAIIELDTAKERISILEKENAMLQKRIESRLELSEITSLLHRMDPKSSSQGNGHALLRDFSTGRDNNKEETHESISHLILKKISREEILDAAQTSGLLDTLRSTLAFWKKNESDDGKTAEIEDTTATSSVTA